MPTISQAIELYLSTKSGSKRTITSYRNGLNAFCQALENGRKIDGLDERETLDPKTTDVSSLDETWISTLIESLKGLSPATESLYITAVNGFYHFLVAERLASPYLPKLERLISERARKVGRRRPKFPRDEIEKLIEYAESLTTKGVEDAGTELKSEANHLAERKRARLRNLRDRAFILILADTGLRVSEACSLTLGDIDFLEGRLSIIGKGDNEDIVRISERAMAALRDYLAAQDLDARRKALQEKERNRGKSGRRNLVQEKSLYVFVRHDRGAKNDAGRIAASTAWDFVRARAVEAVGEEAAAQIHPHSFRHYFVTVVLLATNNIEKARRMARHRNISTTQLYAEIDPELDQDYHEIFNARSQEK
jgi:integrase/recombinase XerC